MTLKDKIAVACPDGLGLCVGLDPVLSKMPDRFQSAKNPLLEFNLSIIEATAQFASAYKPNIAFYEAHGAAGWIQLKNTIEAIPKDKVIIVDAKRGDIGNTAKAYAIAVFDELCADMVTVSPYLGKDSLSPFIHNNERGIFVLALTSNPGSADIQELASSGEKIYSHVVTMAMSLNQNKNVGLVVGATKPEILPEILDKAEGLPLLIPGIGAQGGSVATLKAAMSGFSNPGFVNVSRQIIYASHSGNYENAVRESAMKIHDEIAR